MFITPSITINDYVVVGRQCVAVCCSVWLQCVAACCSVLQRVAACCSVLQRVAVCCSVLQRIASYCSALQCVAVRCVVLRCVAVCCSVLQCVFAHEEWHISACRDAWLLFRWCDTLTYRPSFAKTHDSIFIMSCTNIYSSYAKTHYSIACDVMHWYITTHEQRRMTPFHMMSRTNISPLVCKDTWLHFYSIMSCTNNSLLMFNDTWPLSRWCHTLTYHPSWAKTNDSVSYDVMH